MAILIGRKCHSNASNNIVAVLHMVQGQRWRAVSTCLRLIFSNWVRIENLGGFAPIWCLYHFGGSPIQGTTIGMSHLRSLSIAQVCGKMFYGGHGRA